MTPPYDRLPLRGEIWWVHFAFDSPGKNRPAVIVSIDARNRHPRATTVLAIPLSRSTHKPALTHLLLKAGETGLREDSVAWAENIATITRDQLVGKVEGHRLVSHTRICQLSQLVKLAMGCIE
jgi:mRNA-degrading endonuclease toxin of MazEF toxin-antitoxin module